MFDKQYSDKCLILWLSIATQLSDLPIFIDASIDKSTLIFIDWLLRAKYKFIL